MRSKQIVIIIFILILSQSKESNAGVREMILDNGSTIFLEPAPDKECVTIALMVDKSAVSDEKNYGVSTGLYLNSVLNELNGVVDNAVKSIQRRIPEDPYNWTEHQYIIIRLTREEFSQKKGKLIPILIRSPEYSKTGIEKLIMDYENVQTDSILYSDEVWHEISKDYMKLLNFKPSDFEFLVNPLKIASAVKIYFYGNFDVINLIKHLPDGENNHSISRIQSSKNSIFLKAEPVSIDHDNNYSVLKFSYSELVPRVNVYNLYISDYIKLNNALFNKSAAVRIYYPWTSTKPALIILFEHNKKQVVFSDHMELINGIKSVALNEFREWYKNRYLRHLERIKVSPEDYVVYKMLSSIYFGRSDCFEKVRTDPSVLYHELKNLISEIEVELLQ